MELKTYEFPFGLTLDDDGHEQHQRLATDDDTEEILSEGPGSPSDHIWMLVEAEQDRFPQLDQKTALERVRKKNPKLFRLYASESAGKLRVY